MKIGIQTWGSTGDTNPFIALAAGLADAGHEVTLAITCIDRRDFVPLGEQLGFKILQSKIGDDERRVNAIGKQVFTIKDPLKQMRLIYTKLFVPHEAEMYAVSQRLCAENELIIGHFIHHPLHLAAELAHKPYFTVSLHHGTIPTCNSSPHPLPSLGRWLNPWLWKLTEAVINKIILPTVNGFRSTHGAPPVSSIRDVWESPLCNLIAVSCQLAVPQADWGANQQVCGFFNLPDRASEWQIPDDLQRFLDSGSSPVYITFGSMMGLPESSRDLDETIRLWSEAVQLAGCRAIIQTHWSHACSVAENKNIFRIEHAAHNRIFPHCAAVVHHGGAGTTQSSLRAGCPSIVVAHIADQFFWGSELYNHGVAAKPIKRQQATAAKLARAICQVTGNPQMKANAEMMGKAMQDEDGVQEAIGIIEQFGKMLKKTE